MQSKRVLLAVAFICLAVVTIASGFYWGQSPRANSSGPERKKRNLKEEVIPLETFGDREPLLDLTELQFWGLLRRKIAEIHAEKRSAKYNVGVFLVSRP
ncbi:MAG: hypothetical protein ACT4OT_12115 [Acidobacteriota bacterium]